MKTIYEFSGLDLVDLQSDFGALIHREFFDGELRTEARDGFSLIVQKALEQPIALIRVLSNSSVSYRRGWRHIRENKTDVRVIRFVRRGAVEFVRSCGNMTVNAGEFSIVDSSVPFHVKSMTDGEMFEMILAIVPAHLFMRYLHAASDFQEMLTLEYDEQECVEKLLGLLCELGDKVDFRIANPLVEAFLEAISQRIFEAIGHTPSSKTPRQELLTRIKSETLRNITNPNLHHKDVARQCGISSRYLYYVLKSENITFSRMVWNMRLEKARDWLQLPELAGRTIREIAFMAGFRDAAHFSRSFRETYGLSPKQHRADIDVAAA